MDFFLGEITRDHEDIDWFAWTADAGALAEGLLLHGYRPVPGPAPTCSSISPRTGWTAASRSWTGMRPAVWWSPGVPGPVRPGPRECSTPGRAVSVVCSVRSSVRRPRSRSSG
ncbi:hypothetical protein [Streptomyces kutzneri]|uniref:hypothetical protein n=1 Tax=Streptomyces kutzneri TaxID=3051179 RepID=UPI003F97063F